MTQQKSGEYSTNLQTTQRKKQTDKNRKKLRTSTLEENLENLFTNDSTKSYFDEKYKKKVETGISNLNPILQPLDKIHPEFAKEGAGHKKLKYS